MTTTAQGHVLSLKTMRGESVSITRRGQCKPVSQKLYYCVVGKHEEGGNRGERGVFLVITTGLEQVLSCH